MSELAIRARGLSKQYQVGSRREPYQTLRESVMRALGRVGRRSATQAPPGWFWALREVTFKVEPGEIVGVIGRNGAGKSTLLKILSRITEPTEGTAQVWGRVSSLLEVGTGFHPELSGRENIYLNGAILGMRRAEINRKFDAMVAFAEVEPFIDMPVKRYSTGMHLRLAFSVAAHLEPEVLLVDEVLAVGDAVFQKKCLGKMDQVAQGGRTILFVSHNMAAIQRLCPRTILLDQGAVVADGPSSEVVARYLASGLHQQGERVWASAAEAPGDDVVRLRAVRACRLEGEVASEFAVTEPFAIDVEFWVLKPGFLLDASLCFYDESGTLLCIVGDFQDGTWQGRPRPTGLHRSRCRVPANLFNEGTLSVLAGISTNPHTLHAQERDALSLRLTDDLSPGGARGHYTRPWPRAAVRPLLQWTCTYTTQPDGAGAPAVAVGAGQA